MKIYVVHFDSGSKVFLAAENRAIALHLAQRWFREKPVKLYPAINPKEGAQMNQS